MDMDNQSNHPSSPPWIPTLKKFSERLEDALPAGDLPLPPDLRPPIKTAVSRGTDQPCLVMEVFYDFYEDSLIHLVGIRDIGT